MSPGRLGEQLGKRDPFDSPEQEAHLGLMRAASSLAGPFHALFKRHRLTDASYNTLRILRGHLNSGETEGVRASRIGAELVVRVPDVTRLVDRLVDMGLVERSACPRDRRVVFVKITRPGLDLLAVLDRPVRDLHHATLGHLSHADLESLILLLGAAREHLDPPRNPRTPRAPHAPRAPRAPLPPASNAPTGSNASGLNQTDFTRSDRPHHLADGVSRS
jgi:DNA-binding MarR family transcriptional regulator